MRQLILFGLFLILGRAAAAQATLSLKQYQKLKQEAESQTAKYNSLTKNIPLLRRRNDSLARKKRTDSISYVNSLQQKSGSIAAIDQQIQLTENELHQQRVALHQLASDSLTTAGKLGTMSRTNDSLRNILQNDQKEMLEKQGKISLSLDLRDMDNWINLYLDGLTERARLILSHPYDSVTCTEAIGQINSPITTVPHDSIARYQRLLTGYCTINAEVVQVIEGVGLDLVGGLQDLAVKELTQKANAIKENEYPFLHQELLRISILVKAHKVNDENLFSQTPIRKTECK